ncbi:MAG: DUF4190 domain-containing protein [Verrucomicrobiales bacterium]
MNSPDSTAPQPQSNPSAGWSLGLGIVSFFIPVLLSIPAIILGHMGFGRSKRRNGAGGGMAITGLILGYLSLLIGVTITGIALLASFSVPVYGKITERAKETKALAHGKQLSLDVFNYSIDHGGDLPPSLDVFREQAHSPLAKETYEKLQHYAGLEGDLFTLVASGNMRDLDPKVPMLESQPISKGKKKIIIYVDGSGEVVEIGGP